MLIEECDVLHLILGPVHLDLLGLVVDINKIVLDLKGIPGTLLGNIFCQLSSTAPPAGGANQVAGNVATRMVVNRFTAVGKRIVGQGTAISSYGQGRHECHVVHLILGPVHLNLLGLVADLNKILVDVNAVPGTVLGNIFCLLSSDPPPPAPTPWPLPAPRSRRHVMRRRQEVIRSDTGVTQTEDHEGGEAPHLRAFPL